MIHYDSPGGSYFEAILIAIRRAGQRIESIGGYLGSAEEATSPAWKWQLLTAAGQAHAEAIARLDEADERLLRLGRSDELPAPLDQLPSRLEAMRADLRAAKGRIEQALVSAVNHPAGSA